MKITDKQIQAIRLLERQRERRKIISEVKKTKETYVETRTSNGICVTCKGYDSPVCGFCTERNESTERINEKIDSIIDRIKGIE